jgi:hypothetical protein
MQNVSGAAIAVFIGIDAQYISRLVQNGTWPQPASTGNLSTTGTIAAYGWQWTPANAITIANAADAEIAQIQQWQAQAAATAAAA